MAPWLMFEREFLRGIKRYWSRPADRCLGTNLKTCLLSMHFIWGLKLLPGCLSSHMRSCVLSLQRAERRMAVRFRHTYPVNRVAMVSRISDLTGGVPGDLRGALHSDRRGVGDVAVCCGIRSISVFMFILALCCVCVCACILSWWSAQITFVAGGTHMD